MTYTDTKKPPPGIPGGGFTKTGFSGKQKTSTDDIPTVPPIQGFLHYGHRRIVVWAPAI